MCYVASMGVCSAKSAPHAQGDACTTLSHSNLDWRANNLYIAMYGHNSCPCERILAATGRKRRSTKLTRCLFLALPIVIIKVSGVVPHLVNGMMWSIHEQSRGTRGSVFGQPSLSGARATRRNTLRIQSKSNYDEPLQSCGWFTPVLLVLPK